MRNPRNTLKEVLWKVEDRAPSLSGADIGILVVISFACVCGLLVFLLG